MKKGDPRVGNSVGGYHSNETRVEHSAIGIAENGKLKKYQLPRLGVKSPSAETE